jgi:hypothetical protein
MKASPNKLVLYEFPASEGRAFYEVLQGRTPSLFRPGERLRIGIESDDVNIGMKSLDQHGQRPRAAADVEHAMTQPNSRLIEECSPCGIATKQFHEGIDRRSIGG